MSKARSPRDVCSTTMGTRGLMRAAVYRSPPAAPRRGRPRRARRRPGGEGSGLAGRSEAALLGLLGLLLVGSPDLFPGSGLLEGDRGGVLDDEVGCLAHLHLVAEQVVAPAVPEPLEDPLGRGLSLPRPDRLDQLVVGGVDA